MYNYAIRFEQDDAPGVAVFCRDLPELNSYSDDRLDTVQEAIDAIETVFSLYRDQRRAMPQATPPQADEHVVRLPPATVAEIGAWNLLIGRP